MGIHLRLKRRNADGSDAEHTTRVVLDPDFYDDINEVIDYLDDIIFHDVGGTFLTANQDTFDLSPNQYSAIAVVQDA